MKLFDILRQGVATSPGSIALIHGERDITFTDLFISAIRLSKFLEKSAVKKGERVAILFENSLEYVISFFAVTNAGYVVVPLDTSLKPDKFKYILNDCGAKILIIQKRYTRYISDILDEHSSVDLVISDREMNLQSIGIQTKLLPDILKDESTNIDFQNAIDGIDEILQRDQLRHDNIEGCPKELAAIYYTSGSTGEPKGVMLSHRNLISNTLATVEYLNLKPSDSIIVILPFYYIYGNSLLLTHIVTGAKTIIDNRFMFPQVVLETMIEHKVTGFSGVPSNFMILLNNGNFSSEKLTDLKYLTQAGGNMAPDVIRKVMAVFPDKEIFIMYGQTEASPRVTYLPPEKLSQNVGSIGIPLPGATIKLVDDSGREVQQGKVGEIAVFGDCVMMGYWNQPDEQKQVLKDGWLYTGDLARIDENGLIYIVSRKKEILKVGGNRVSAKEVEDKLLEYDGIREAAIIGVPDDILGEAIKAFIVLSDNSDVASKEITDFCKRHLAIHKVPKFIEFIDNLPKYKSGKVNKQELKKLQ